jgi:hypothetical protein
MRFFVKKMVESWNRYGRRIANCSQRRRVRPMLEQMEGRLVPAVYTVSSALDDGSPGTLRWAINQANSGTDNTIDFLISHQSGVAPTITISSPLPAVAGNTVVNGFSELGDYVVGVNINGNGVVGDGLTLNGSGASANGLAIYGMNGNGFILNGTGEILNTINSGTDSTSMGGTGNTGDGVQVTGSYDTIESGATMAVSAGFVGPYAVAGGQNVIVKNGGCDVIEQLGSE